MKGFANDNGCKPSFNKNPFGICQHCPSNRSDCLLFSEEFKVVDNYNYDLVNYKSSEMNETLFSKDFYADEDLYPHNFSELFSSGAVRSNHDMDFAWEFQRRRVTTPCYAMRLDRKNEYNYLLDSKADYYLAKAKDYKQYDISQQAYDIYNGSLTELICLKDCDVGFFYEFESVTCRKCDMGCGICSKFDNCTKCIPGFNQIKGSTSHKDIQEDYPIGFCRPGCQPGFYPIRFNGTCRECPGECLRCRDKQSHEMNKSREIGIKNDMYCIQCREKNEKGEVQYSDLNTGECITKCEGFGTFPDEIKNNVTKQSYRVCGTCFDEDCEECSKDPKEGACTKCRSGYALEADGSCLYFWRTERGEMIIAGIIVGSITALLIVFALILFVATGTPTGVPGESEEAGKSPGAKLRKKGALIQNMKKLQKNEKVDPEKIGYETVVQEKIGHETISQEKIDHEKIDHEKIGQEDWLTGFDEHLQKETQGINHPRSSFIGKSAHHNITAQQNQQNGFKFSQQELEIAEDSIKEGSRAGAPIKNMEPQGSNMKVKVKQASAHEQ